MNIELGEVTATPVTGFETMAMGHSIVLVPIAGGVPVSSYIATRQAIEQLILDLQLRLHELA